MTSAEFIEKVSFLTKHLFLHIDEMNEIQLKCLATAMTEYHITIMTFLGLKHNFNPEELTDKKFYSLETNALYEVITANIKKEINSKKLYERIQKSLQKKKELIMIEKIKECTKKEKYTN